MRFSACLVMAAAVAAGGCAVPSHTAPLDTLEVSHIQWYGFAGVVCRLDDPHDRSATVDYLDEVAQFTNLAHVCVLEPDLTEELERISAAQARALLDVTLLLFEAVPGDSPSGSGWRFVLREDAEQMWRDFLLTNRGVLTADHVAAIYLIDEPVWNGATAADIEAAAAMVHRDLPATPALIVEAADVLGQAVFPPTVSWIGFDSYGIADPVSDPAYRADLARLSEMAVPGQRLVLIADTQWHPFYREAGLEPEDMAQVAAGYAELAADTPAVVAMIGYSWPGGIDGARQWGARDLPASLGRVLRAIGDQILE
ncbi:MAG: hypothetical protein ACK5KO_02720 [Arachnia sp.]